MSHKYIIAIDLGGTNLKIALLDLRYYIRDKKVLSTKSFEKKENLIFAITHSINNLLKDNHLSKRQVLGVGLGLPGPIDVQKGIVHFFPNIPGWKEVNLRTILRQKIGLPIFLDNDANLMSLAEHKLGAARGFKNVICLTLGTGVGGGIILEGKLYRGSNFSAGEIGHIPINEKGSRCNCGGIGCLETYIGNYKIEKEAKKLFKRKVSLEELSNLARRKNRKAITIWSKVGRHLGIALVGIVNVFNPDAIIIGGGVANAGRTLFDEARKIISQQAMSIQARQVKLFKSVLGENAGLIGAAILVKEGL